MKKWILWIIVVFIMISIISGFNNSSSNLSGYSPASGSGYSPATGVLDTSFDGTGILVDDNAAGGKGYDYGNSIYVDNKGRIYVTGYSIRVSPYYADMVIWKYK